MVEDSHLCVTLHQQDCAKICVGIVVTQRKLRCFIESFQETKFQSLGQVGLWSLLWSCKDEFFDEMNQMWKGRRK